MIHRSSFMASICLTSALLSACTPPSQVDSITKVDTTRLATTHRSLPGYIDCLGAPSVEPVTITLDCTHGSQEIRSLHWTTWTEHQAEGYGVLTVSDARGAIVGTERVRSTIVLTNPRRTSNGTVFSTVLINGIEYTL